MEYLDGVEIAHDINERDFRFPVQWVCRPQDEAFHDFRGYAGRIESGAIQVGDEVTVLPSGLTSRVAQIITLDGELARAAAPQSVQLTLDDPLDVSRGDMIVKSDDLPRVTQEFAARICWFDAQPLDLARKYLVKHTTRTVKALVRAIEHKVDVNTLERHPAAMSGSTRSRVSRSGRCNPCSWTLTQRTGRPGASSSSTRPPTIRWPPG